jgi:hypothetical protein
MSARKQIEHAMQRAEARDRKRQPKMKISGKSVFALGRLLGKGKKK